MITLLLMVLAGFVGFAFGWVGGSWARRKPPVKLRRIPPRRKVG